MGEIKYIKINALLLLAIIPLSVVGYLFAVYDESLFFLYEWLLMLLILVSTILSIISIVKIKGNLKWVSISILAFLVQFLVLSLFLGPFTEYSLFSVFYIVTFFAIMIFIATFRKVEKFKFLPVIFIIVSIIFTFYMLFLNSLWGRGF
ncbi:hypothetical protein EDD69_11341 [Thermolongibacillus altinsuensis]|uniref:Uncharacterized protein n=1 Tax=Thermolongibacillus altinsuensis TaxID=575256 RepID=A0A4R1QE52_9BACL|nr:hypothetical protein [Thermolongibacillus altinsuensis]TCL47035.1 hypothetical protein EDD69_11341 [Thermolongibacillus altinsuensis]